MASGSLPVCGAGREYAGGWDRRERACGGALGDSREARKQRAKWRSAWGCDCDGVSHDRPGRAVAFEVDAAREVIERTCLGRPPTCPWRVFDDPLVVDVMSARAMKRAKTAPPYSQLPRRLSQALAAYEDARNRAESERMSRERKKREAEAEAARNQK